MNKDKRNNIKLLGTLNNADESGIIANANQVYDANEDKSTQDVSKEHKERIETLETKESSMQTTLENITKTGEASAASNVTYNHSDSKLDATNVQQAVDEVYSKGNTNRENDKTELEKSISDNKVAVDASIQDVYKKSNYNDGDNIIDFNTIHLITDNPEYICVAVDADEKILYGIKTDGQPYFGVGCPQQVKDYIDEQINKILGTDDITTTIDSLKEIETFLKDFTNSDTLKNLLDLKANVDEVKTTTDDIYKKSNPNDSEGNVVDTNTIISFEDNPEYIKALTDSMGKLIEAIGLDGIKKFFAGINIQGTLQCVTDNPEYIAVWLDNQERIIFGFKINGDPYFGYGIPSQINSVKVDKETGKSLIDENVADSLIFEDNPEYLDSKIDKDGKIITNRTNDGVLHENVGIKTPNLEVSNLKIKGESLNTVLSSDTFIENTASRLNSIGFGRDHTDFSSFTSLHIPIPQCAYANITGNLPTVKGNTTKGTLDFYDMQGNYFKKYVEIDIHGKTSAVFSKKNYTLDFYNDSDYSDSFNLKFGDWVEMDSYYFQGWYTDSFRGIDIIGYQLWQEIIATRGVLKDRPYKYSLYKDITSTSDSNNDVDVNLTSNALTTPMAFPIILYNNGNFLGIYTVMLKKNRANFLMGKKDYKAVMLDLDNGDIVNGKENWTSFEIRNPKTLICMDGSKYDGDNPKELIDSNSDKYDSSNKDIKNTLVTKNVIKGLANAYKEISTAITNGNTDTEIKTLIESHYNVDYVIDYVIFSNVIQNFDGWGGNWQWTTWDGKIWNPNPYDLNSSFGLSPYGNTCDAPTVTLKNAGPTAFISKYYVTELDNRYKELVDDNILTASHIQHLFKEWVDRIGSENFDKEFDKWPNTPSQRDSQLNDEYWKRVTSNVSIGAWNSVTTYNQNYLVSYPTINGHIYKSLVPNNTGNIPNNSNSWEDITYDSEKSYSVGDIVYVIQWGSMGFKCIKSAQGINPLKSIYNEAYGMFGWHDSLPRIYKWLEEKLSLMNKTFKYTK